VDSAFPTGAFAHSGGLEAAWQQGDVEDGEALQRFVQASIRQAATAAIPLINAAYRDPGKIEALDALADAFLTNAVANRASRVQGRTLVATVSRIWPSEELADLRRRAERLCAHVGPLTGAALRVLDLPLATVQRMVLFSTARSVLSAAVRLGMTGSYEAQRLQWLCTPWLDAQLERCAEFDERDLAQTAPILDLLHAGHDRLYSRLFQS